MLRNDINADGAGIVVGVLVAKVEISENFLTQ